MAAAGAAAARPRGANPPDPADWADLLAEEGDPLLTKQSPLRGALLYVDQFHDLVADDSASSKSEPREGYKYSMIETATMLAQQAGAHIARVIAPGVTHIVLDEDHADYTGRKLEADKIVRRVYKRELIAGGPARLPLVVSYAWLLAVTDSGEPWETVRLDCNSA
jgi:hypothetical protein